MNEVPRDEEAEAGETGGNDDDVCQYCGNQPCYVLELKPMFLAIMQAYQDDKTHKQLRFQMYTESVKCIFGTGLGVGVRKRIPRCVQKLIRSLAPDNEYIGFREAEN